MKEISTLNKFTLTAILLAGSAIYATAQTTSTKVPAQVTYQVVEVTNNQQGVDAKGSLNSSISTKEENASLPWFNYKGLTNIEKARKQWLRDNPSVGTGTNSNNTPK